MKKPQYPYIDVLLYKVKLIKESGETNQETRSSNPIYSEMFYFTEPNAGC